MIVDNNIELLSIEEENISRDRAKEGFFHCPRQGQKARREHYLGDSSYIIKWIDENNWEPSDDL